LRKKLAAGFFKNVMALRCLSVAFATRALLLALTISSVGCSKPAATSQQPQLKTFATPDDAGNALIAAGQAGDQATLAAIFGPDSKGILSSGDPVQDKNDANAFMSGYEVMHRWRRMEDGSQVLLVGADNFPFPIPLKKNDARQWFFDTAAGKQELLNRRIGRNELAIIQVCGAVADAQKQYFSQFHDGDHVKQYAAKFISDPGKQNGLYWESAEGQSESPLGPLAAHATSEGYSANPNAPFHGYYFRLLTSQSKNAPGGAKDYMVDGKLARGFALVAYPAEYGNSGVMTFIMNRDGFLLQQDLGNSTTETATSMTEFDPGPGWVPVGE
jgi:Protein of unknown function (DUF2950)